MSKVTDKHKSIISAIAVSIENDEQGIRDLLKRNGVKVDMIKSKKALQSTFINALSKSKSLGIDFHKYIQSKLQGQTLNAIGESEAYGINFNRTLDPFTSQSDKDPLGGNISILPSGSSTITATSESTSGGFFSGINLNELLNSGLKVLELQKEMQVSSDNKTAVESAVQLKRDELNLQPQKSQANTGFIIAIVIGALVVASGIIYAVTRKKK